MATALVRQGRLPSSGLLRFFNYNVNRRYAHDGFAALNILKDPSSAPVEQPDSAYPSWLWKLQEPKRTQQELYREAKALYEAGGFDEVFEKMPEADLKRLFKLEARNRIKESNSLRRGGNVL